MGARRTLARRGTTEHDRLPQKSRTSSARHLRTDSRVRRSIVDNDPERPVGCHSFVANHPLGAGCQRQSDGISAVIRPACNPATDEPNLQLSHRGRHQVLGKRGPGFPAGHVAPHPRGNRASQRSRPYQTDRIAKECGIPMLLRLEMAQEPGPVIWSRSWKCRGGEYHVRALEAGLKHLRKPGKVSIERRSPHTRMTSNHGRG